MSRNSEQVLIVGAGPTGLTAAIELIRQGIPVRIIDKVPPRPAVESRAIGTHSRTMEIFERFDVLQTMLESGKTISGFTFHADGKQIGRLSFDGLEAPYPFVMILLQAEAERILLEKLRQLGVEVERPTELISLEQTDEAVTVRLIQADGKAQEAKFSFLIAADGAHSTVRKQLGLSFNGNKTEGAYVADAQIDWEGTPPEPDSGHMYLGTNRMLIFGLLPTGAWRIGVTLPADDKFMRSEKPTLELLQALIDEHGGINARLQEITWSSVFNISYRKVEKLRHNRIFLAGDAAHIHSPAGGQGMNTGIQDAFNLAWKLALVLKNVGDERLLDSYHAERYPIIEKLLPMIEQSEEMIMVANPLAAKLRNHLLSIVTDFGFVQSLGNRALGGFLVNYRRSPIVGEHDMPFLAHVETLLQGNLHPNPLDEIDFARAPQPGDRAPDADGIIYNDLTQRFFEVLKTDTRHQLFLFAGSVTQNRERKRELLRIIEQINVEFGNFIRLFLVVNEHQEAGEDKSKILYDITGELCKHYGARSECLYLIRPDGYISFRSQPINIKAFTEFWQRNFNQQNN